MRSGTWTYTSERPAGGKDVTVSRTVLVGRQEADVRLDDSQVSRRHARLIPTEGGGLAVEDLDSTNGTWVNDERVASRRNLVDGDLVRFGETVWRIRRQPRAG